MAEENPQSGPSGRRKRRAPVIDLKATELPPEVATPQAPAEMPVDASAPEPAAATSESPPPEPPPPPEPASAARDEPPNPSPPPSRPPNGLPWMAFAAGAGGGLLVSLLLWLAGALSNERAASLDTSPRLAAIEQQLNEIAKRPVPAGVDTKAVDDIAARLGKLESAQAVPRPVATDPVVLGRLTATENAVKAASDNMAGLSRRLDGIDAAVRATNASIEKLATAVAETQATARQAAAGSDRVSRFAIAASALRGAVERGDPFAAELAVVKPLASDGDAIAALEPFATTGLTSPAALGQELVALVRAMPRAQAATPGNGTVLDRLAASAERLVRVRRVGDVQGDDRDAILDRIGQRAAQGRIADAKAELSKLPAEARAPAQSWIAKVEARDKALAASRKLSADAVAALKAAP